MSDNTTLSVGTGGDVIATDDIGGVKYQRTKVNYGDDGVATDVSATNPLPAYLPSQTVTGTLTATGSVTISDLKGAATVTIEGVATSMTTHTAAVEVLTGSGTWELAKWIYGVGTAGSLPVPTNLGSLSVALASSSVRAIVDVAGHVGVRWRSVSFSGTSFAVTLASSYGPTSRIGPDVETANKSMNLAQVGANNIASFTPNSSVQVVGSGLAVGALAATPFTAEVASSARTATGNSGTINDTLCGAISATLNVTAVSGTAPTLDLALQESPDNGTTWIDVYHAERVTATGVYALPSVPLNGRRRWLWTVAGTTPSFTFSVSSNRGGFAQYPRFVQFFDRTAGLLSGSLNAVSASYWIAGCNTITAAITIGAATTGGTYKLRGSMDGTNFYDLSSTVVAVASSTVQITSTAGVTARFVQVLCSSAASGQTGTVVGITGTN